MSKRNITPTTTIEQFKLPRYEELPNTGLYLEQTALYVNQLLAPLCCPALTPSMISNYVKKKLIANPVRKQYQAEQIAHLIVIAILKKVLPMEHIHKFFSLQRVVYTDSVAYDYFCADLENVLRFVYGYQQAIEEIGATSRKEKMMLHKTIVAVAHLIYLDDCFRHLEASRPEDSFSN